MDSENLVFMLTLLYADFTSYKLMLSSLWSFAFIWWCPAASWHLYSWTFSSRGSKISLHCINGRVCVQDWRPTAASEIYVPFVQWFWLRDHPWSREQPQSAGEIQIRNFCREISLFVLYSEYLASLQAYLFNDYWEDIGTIKSLFDANLALTEQVNHSLRNHLHKFSFSV